MDFEYWVVLIFALGILFFVVRDIHTYLSKKTEGNKLSERNLFLLNKAFFSGVVVSLLTSIYLSTFIVRSPDVWNSKEGWFNFSIVFTLLCLIGYLVTLRPPRND